jgi:malonate-semialdehyde dehydrogenase (acetylating)/methylmalonate-semialdehyde dehydrogenase
MSKLKVLLEENADKIAALITAEHGKVLADAHGELQRGIENVEYASYAPELLKGEHSRNVGPGIDSWSEFQALGVVAGITPFNFRPWCRCGCGPWPWPAATPSCSSPPSAIPAAPVHRPAGAGSRPAPGVLNVVNGDKEAVDTLLQDPRVKAVSFVGSTPSPNTSTRRLQARQARAGPGRRQEPRRADARRRRGQRRQRADGRGLRLCGERCMAIPLLVAVGDEVGDAVIAGLKAEIAKMKVGPGTDNGNDMGPLVTKQHFEKVKAYVDSGVAEGATLVVDGRGVKVAGHEDGYFLGACLFDNVKPGMKIYQEEIFGPVLGVVRVQTLQRPCS